MLFQNYAPPEPPSAGGSDVPPPEAGQAFVDTSTNRVFQKSCPRLNELGPKRQSSFFLPFLQDVCLWTLALPCRKYGMMFIPVKGFR